jgi:hypothetical protein
MKMVLRRLLAAAAVVTALLIGSGATMAHAAPTPSPTTSHAAATPGASATPNEDDTDVNIGADAAVDRTRMIWVLGGAGLIAVIAAAVVVARH